jgi:hypothetical protein
MARAKNQRNGKLDEAMRALLLAQAQMVQNQAAFQGQINESQRIASERFAQLEQRIARVEAILLDHSRILAEHTRILAEHSRTLEKLPDAIREKIGFKPPQSS